MLMTLRFHRLSLRRVRTLQAGSMPA